ncbi:MAG: DUF5666 domain-containing protein [Burkholderiales bacterium]
MTRSNPLRHRPVQGLLCVLFAALAITACGGGGSGSSTDTAAAGTTSFASGPITGFGSVIVNGVRFDDSKASISDDDGVAHTSGELRLGMMAEIESAGIVSDSSGSHSLARAIRFGSELVGPVSAIAADGSSIVVLGETVQINPATLFDDRLVGGITALVAGTTIVEVHGLLDAATGAYTATRIEPKPNAPFFKIRGVVSNIDKTAHTLRIGTGTDTISYDAISATVPTTLDNGLLVRVRLQTTQVAGQWVAATVVSGVRKLEDHDEAELEGAITATTFETDKKFSVNGIAVDATNATFPDGTAGIVLGARVEVKGSAVNGVVVATRVSIETEHEREDAGFELHGAISALDTTAKTFVLRGVTVNYGGSAVEFRKGTAADLANDRKVEVKGTRSADGTTLTATRISFED